MKNLGKVAWHLWQLWRFALLASPAMRLTLIELLREDAEWLLDSDQQERALVEMIRAAREQN